MITAASTVGEAPIGFMPYDEALQKFFSMMVYPDKQEQRVGRLITPIMGPPRIEFSTQEYLNPTDNLPDIEKDTLHLPVSSLTQLNWVFDLSRWTKAHFRMLGWTEEGRRVMQSPQLVPVKVSYQLDLWTKYRVTMNQMVNTTMLKLIQREIWLPVDLKGVWGLRNICLFPTYNGPVNMSEYEPANKDRTVRMVFSFSLDAWVIPDATMLPTVRANMYQLYVAEKNASPFPATRDLPPYPGWMFDKTIILEPLPTDKPSPNP